MTRDTSINCSCSHEGVAEVQNEDTEENPYTNTNEEITEGNKRTR